MIAEALVDAVVKEGYEAVFIGSTSGQDRKYFEKNSKFSHVYFLETTLQAKNKKLFSEKIKSLPKTAFFWQIQF